MNSSRLGVIALLATGCGVVFWVVVFVPTGVFRAHVREYPSGRPLEGVQVWDRSVGWGWSRGVFVMGAVIGDSTYTDARGEFRLPKPSLLAWLDRNPAFYARKPGYGGRTGMRGREWRPTIWMTPLAAGHENVRYRYLSIECGPRRMWSLWDCDSVSGTDSTSADVVFFTDPGDSAHLYVRAFGAGGLIYQPGRGEPGERPAPLACLAPDSGYERQVRVPLADGPGTCFVRTRDGARYAKVDLDPSELRAWMKGPYPYGVAQRAWFNPSGGRALCCTEPHPD